MSEAVIESHPPARKRIDLPPEGIQTRPAASPRIPATVGPRVPLGRPRSEPPCTCYPTSRRRQGCSSSCNPKPRERNQTMTTDTHPSAEPLSLRRDEAPRRRKGAFGPGSHAWPNADGKGFSSTSCRSTGRHRHARTHGRGRRAMMPSCTPSCGNLPVPSMVPAQHQPQNTLYGRRKKPRRPPEPIGCLMNSPWPNWVRRRIRTLDPNLGKVAIRKCIRELDAGFRRTKRRTNPVASTAASG